MKVTEEDINVAASFIRLRLEALLNGLPQTDLDGMSPHTIRQERKRSKRLQEEVTRSQPDPTIRWGPGRRQW